MAAVMQWWQEAQSFMALTSQEKLAFVFFFLRPKEKQVVTQYELILESLSQPISQDIILKCELEYFALPRSLTFFPWTVLQSNFQHLCCMSFYLHPSDCGQSRAGTTMLQCLKRPLKRSLYYHLDNVATSFVLLDSFKGPDIRNTTLTTHCAI